jgi:hypothetical protein
VTLLFSYPAIDDITAYVTAELFGPPAVEQAPASSSNVFDAIEELSDEEVDRLLSVRMGDRS